MTPDSRTLEAHHLVKRFHGHAAVSNVSFALRPGEILGYLGPNGSGKSLTLKMLTGLIRPSSGEARVLGHVPFDRRRTFLSNITLVMGQKQQLLWDLPALDSLKVNAAVYDIPKAVADARVPIWDKFVYLVAFSGFTGASRLAIGHIWKYPHVQEMFYACSREIAAIAKAEGVTISANRFDTLREYMENLPPATRSSLLIDLEQGKRIEVEALQGAAVRRAAKHGVPVPIVSTLYSVLKAWENGPIKP